MVRSWLDRLYLTSGWLAAGCIGLICLLVVAQVILNLIDRLSTLLTGTAIGLTIPSYSDFTGFFLAAASFFALAHTLRAGAHIRVTLLLGNFSRPLRRLVELWCVMVASAITGYFCWYTALLVGESYRYNDLSTGMVAVPIWMPQSAMLAGLLILLVALFDDLVRIAAGGIPSYEDQGEALLGSASPPAAPDGMNRGGGEDE